MRFRPPAFVVTEGDPFANDKLGRKMQIEALVRLVENIEGPCVLAVDGTWGCGKTVFLQMWAQMLRKEEGIRVVEFNAWDTDFSDDPLVALYAALEGVLDRGRNHGALLEAGVRMLSEVASTIIRTDVVAAIEKSQEQADESTKERLKRFRAAQKAIGDFEEALAEATKSGGRIVVCVDELDRCRPDYAIRFLEATKHIFEVDGVVFLLAVNLSELTNSVKALYGGQFDGQKYLRRFVDHILYLQTDRSRFLKHLLESSGLGWLQHYSSLGFEGLETYLLAPGDMTLRDLEQAIHHLGIVVNALESPRASTPVDIGLTMIIFRIILPDTYLKLVRGEISDSEALAALNQRINRPDDWWRHEPRHSNNRSQGAALERSLIGWYEYIHRAKTAQSPLLQQREEEKAADETPHSYPNQVVSTSRHSRISQDFHRAASIVEMISYEG